MLTIYTNKDIMKDDRFIFDVESLFAISSIEGNDFVRIVISGIDKGEYFDNTSFVDRYGRVSLMENLSTTSKALICVNKYPDKIINLVETGSNAGDYLLMLEKGLVYLPFDRLECLSWRLLGSFNGIIINNRSFLNYNNFRDYIEG